VSETLSLSRVHAGDGCIHRFGKELFMIASLRADMLTNNTNGKVTLTEY
jgi:hypothetical protein